MVSHDTSNSSSEAKAGEKRRSNDQPSISYAVRSDIGCEREVNEDRCLTFQSVSGQGFFVFDGMGGELGGAAAAEISLEAIQAFFAHTREACDCALMEQAITLAHTNVKNLRKTSKMTTMGTTVVGAIVTDDHICIGSVGDSRAYRISADGIEQVTHDHTVVQTMVDQGELSSEDALVHPYSHILTSCLGSQEGFGIDSMSFFIDRAEAATKERLLLCTDGLYSLVSEPELQQIVSTMKPEQAGDHLIALARERGGFDNISAIVIELGGVLCTEIASHIVPEQAPEMIETSRVSDTQQEALKEQKPIRSRSGFIRSCALFLLVAGCFALLSMGAILFLRR